MLLFSLENLKFLFYSAKLLVYFTATDIIRHARICFQARAALTLRTLEKYILREMNFSFLITEKLPLVVIFETFCQFCQIWQIANHGGG